MTLADELALLAGDYTRLDARLRHIAFNTSMCGERIDVRASYLSFRDGEPTVDEFIQSVFEYIIPFALPRKEMQDTHNFCKGASPADAASAYSRLHSRAVELFMKAKEGSHRSGEFGEIALFILLEWLLKAPQIVSKMYLKTANNMPVHGTDGIHAKLDADTGQLYLYWGESKAHKTLSGAMSSALESITKFAAEGKERREIEITSAYLDAETLPAGMKEALLEYLDPYSEKSNERVAVFACFLAFDFPYTAQEVEAEISEAWFRGEFQKIAEAFISNLTQTVTDASLSQKRFEFFLLPTPSVQTLRDKFQEKIGWPNA